MSFSWNTKVGTPPPLYVLIGWENHVRLHSATLRRWICHKGSSFVFMIILQQEVKGINFPNQMFLSGHLGDVGEGRMGHY